MSRRSFREGGGRSSDADRYDDRYDSRRDRYSDRDRYTDRGDSRRDRDRDRERSPSAHRRRRSRSRSPRRERREERPFLEAPGLRTLSGTERIDYFARRLGVQEPILGDRAGLGAGASQPTQDETADPLARIMERRKPQQEPADNAPRAAENPPQKTFYADIEAMMSQAEAAKSQPAAEGAPEESNRPVLPPQTHAPARSGQAPTQPAEDTSAPEPPKKKLSYMQQQLQKAKRIKAENDKKRMEEQQLESMGGKKGEMLRFQREVERTASTLGSRQGDDFFAISCNAHRAL